MKLFYLLTLLTFSTLCYSQQLNDSPSNCNNGIKDGNEDGVDCGPTCIPCNGEAVVTYNSRVLKSGKIIVSNSMLKNLSGRIFEKDRINYTFLYFPFSYESNGANIQLGIGFKYIRFDKMEPQKVYLTGGTDRDFEWADASPEQGEMMQVHENFVFLDITKNEFNVSKLKLRDKGKSRYIIEITKVNNIERLISGNISLYGVTADGTPIDILGTFNNVSY